MGIVGMILMTLAIATIISLEFGSDDISYTGCTKIKYSFKQFIRCSKSSKGF